MKTGQVKKAGYEIAGGPSPKGAGPPSPAVTVDQSHWDPARAGAGTVHKLNNVVSR